MTTPWRLTCLDSHGRGSTNSVRPYKGYSTIRQRVSDSTSNYHSIPVYATKRKGRLTFTTSYTWSKVLSGSNSNTENPENPYDRHYSYGPGSFDRSHVAVVTGTYQIPMIKTLPSRRRTALFYLGSAFRL